jgi:hypothetical protein
MFPDAGLRRYDGVSQRRRRQGDEMKRLTGALVALMLILVGLTAASHAGAQPRASATSAPTLGLHQKFTEGFGRVRPRVVSYGGDPTSLVAKVHWNSWGGARAVGHGEADWVWPGWCVACGSVNLPATVVAFGLRSCGGHPAYSHVEWYFPSRGMTFSRHLGNVNVCNPRSASPVTEPPHAGCALVRAPGALITKIAVFGFGVRCPAARALLAKLDPISHYRHNARFHVGSWWCGSELIMQVTKTGPQSFECESGDDNDVSFDIMPSGDVTPG